MTERLATRSAEPAPAPASATPPQGRAHARPAKAPTAAPAPAAATQPASAAAASPVVPADPRAPAVARERPGNAPPAEHRHPAPAGTPRDRAAPAPAATPAMHERPGASDGTRPGRWTRLVRRLKRDVVWAFVLPGVLATLYYAFVAQGQYVSEAVVSLRSVAIDATDDSALSLLGLASRSRSETAGLREYMLSTDIALQLDRELALRAHWSAPTWDVVAKLWRPWRQEDYVKHYRSAVRIELDDVSGALRIRTYAFDPETSLKLAQALVSRTELYANRLTQAMMAEQLRFVMQEVQAAQTRLLEAREELAAHVNRYGVIRPEDRVAAEGALLAKLEGDLVSAEAELSAGSVYFTTGSAQLSTLKSKRDAIAEQLRKARARLKALDQTLPEQVIRERQLRERAGFLEDLLHKAMANQELARVEASRKAKTLAVLSAPVLPDWPDKPDRVLMIIASWIVAAGLWALARLGRTLIMEHRR